MVYSGLGEAFYHNACRSDAGISRSGSWLADWHWPAVPNPSPRPRQLPNLRRQPKPYRVLDVGVYQGSYLMAHDIQTMLGYHGFELRFYDELMGGKNEWRNAGSPNLHELLAVRFLLLPDSQAVPGFHRVLGPVTTTPGQVGNLYERDTAPAYLRVVAGAAKLLGISRPTLYDLLKQYRLTA